MAEDDTAKNKEPTLNDIIDILVGLDYLDRMQLAQAVRVVVASNGKRNSFITAITSDLAQYGMKMTHGEIDSCKPGDTSDRKYRDSIAYTRRLNEECAVDDVSMGLQRAGVRPGDIEQIMSLFRQVGAAGRDKTWPYVH